MQAAHIGTLLVPARVCVKVSATSQAVARRAQVCMTRARYPREGGRSLSAKNRGETEGADHPRRSKNPSTSDKKGRKQRPSDLGRALRSIYDDTLRENVPDDFIDLLGKLS